MTKPNEEKPPVEKVQTARATQRPKKQRQHYTHIDGLRGLAIALVVIFHIFVGKVSAGVDVFLLIGGVFFFASQYRNALNPRGMTFIQSIWRILRRLFPALAVVVGTIFAAGLIIYPSAYWEGLSADSVSSLLYIENFSLAQRGQDYAAIGAGASLFQHIWSMSAQLQIYIGSLLVLTVLALIMRGRRGEQTVFRVLLLLATAASLAYATYMHEVDQGWNYYSPLSRFWEIGLGGVLGVWLLAPRKSRLTTTTRGVLGFVGIFMIVLTGVFFDGANQFPGAWTLVPLTGALFVIISGIGQERTVIAAILDTEFFQFLGRVSYALYLWHWPVLVLATFSFANAEEAAEAADQGAGIQSILGWGKGLPIGIGVVILSLVLAQITFKYVETPLRQGAKPERAWLPQELRLPTQIREGKGKMVVASFTVVVIAGAVMGASQVTSTWNKQLAVDVSSEITATAEHPGPSALGRDTFDYSEDILPVPSAPVDTMFPPTHEDGCATPIPDPGLVLTHQRNESDERCAYGDLDADRTIYLVGSSHIEQHIPAMDIIGKRRGIRFETLIKLGCNLGGETKRDDGDDYPECEQWQETAMDWILDNPPSDGVVMMSTYPGAGVRGPDKAVDGMTKAAKQLNDAGIHVFGMRATPRPHVDGAALDVRLCVADGRYDPENGEDCGMAREDVYAPTNPAEKSMRGMDVTHVDLADSLCTADHCPGVVGNVLVYRDSSHLTDYYDALLADEIERRMFGSVTAAPAD